MKKTPITGTDGITIQPLDHDVWAFDARKAHPMKIAAFLTLGDFLKLFQGSDKQKLEQLKKLFHEIQELNYFIDERLEIPSFEILFYSVINLDTNEDHIIESPIYVN